MYINVQGQTIYYQRVGKGQPLIFLHGWKQDVSTFWPLVDALKDDFTLWLIDLPGFGRSDLPKKAFLVSDYAEIVKEFIEQEKINHPSILGHSLGGRISIKLAAKFPHLIDKIILEDAAGIKPKQDGLKPLFYVGAKIFKIFIPDILGLKTKFRYSFYKSLEADYFDAGEMTATLTNILNEDLTSDLPKIKNETLIIWGEKDKAVPVSDGKKMYRLIPNSRLEIIDNIGHFPHLENPQKFLYLVKDFLL